MKDFQYYYDCFANLHTAQSKKLPAPHKPLLLLSVIDLVDRGFITSNRIELTDLLVSTFKANARKYIGNSIVFRPNIGQPFYHLQYEPFWRLVSKAQMVEMDMAAEGWAPADSSKPVYSIKGLRERYHFALMDEELFDLLQNEDVRAKLRTLLISRYFAQQPNSITPLVAIPIALAISLIA